MPTISYRLVKKNESRSGNSEMDLFWKKTWRQHFSSARSAIFPKHFLNAYRFVLFSKNQGLPGVSFLILKLAFSDDHGHLQTCYCAEVDSYTGW